MKSRGGRRDIQQKAEAEKFQVPSAHIYRTLFCGLSTCWILLTCSRLSPSKNIDQCKLQWISLILPHVSHFPKGLHHCSTFWSSLIHSTFLYHSDVPCSVLDGYWHFGGTSCLLFGVQDEAMESSITLVLNRLVGITSPKTFFTSHCLKNLKSHILISFHLH